MQQRGLRQYLTLAFKGMAMGAADVVPGVSGGTIAFISGIYEELLSAISAFDRAAFASLFARRFKEFWKHINGSFLVVLLSGILISVVSLAQLLSWMLEHKPVLLWSFFFGLVLASIIFVGKEIRSRALWVWLLLILGAVLAYYITTLEPLVTGGSSLFYLFLILIETFKNIYFIYILYIRYRKYMLICDLSGVLVYGIKENNLFW